MMTPKQVGFYARVQLGFARKSDADLLPFAENIVTQMTGNPAFPTPLPSLADVAASATTFDQSIKDALDGGKILTARRNANRESLLTLLRSLAAYVTNACGNDVLTLLTSGFEAVKTPTKVGVLQAPENLRLAYTGMSGQMLLRFSGNSNARNYSVECSLSVDGPWEDRGLSTTTRVTLDSLVPGKNYWARICANGTAGPSEWSVPTTAMAV